MYGSTNNFSAAPKAPAGINEFLKFGIYRVSSQPSESSAVGTIAVKAQMEITSFTVIFKDNVNGTTISSNQLFQNATIGAVFYIIDTTDPHTNELYIYSANKKIEIYLHTGTQMYQKTSATGNLTAVDAWICKGGWVSMNY